MGGSEFVFEQPSDEESPDFEGSKDSDSDSDTPNKFQSPWDFSSYSESVAKEHDRRNTTSIDEKISKARKEHFIPLPNPNDEDDSDVEPPHNQEDQKPEEDDSEDDDNHDNANGKEESFFAPSEGVSFHAKTFLELNLSRPLLRACEALGYTKPTPVQSACIPLALMGRDICGSAITGSGKTASFSLPVLERLLCCPKRVPAIRALILTPTRELAVQVHSMIGKLAQFTDIRCCLIVGGLSTKEQEVSLRSLPDIVVATPGRLIDHLRNSISVDLDSLAVLILDEADRLLEIGFSAEIRELIRLCPKRRQTLLFSATMTEEVNELAKLSLTKPLRLSADPSAKRPEKLTEEVVRIRRSREAHQEAVLFALCSKTFTSQVIIFGGTKEAAHRLMILFGLAGYKAAEFHSGLTQAQRLEALERFRRQEVEFLIATDVAARGLDIVGVRTVINFVCPRDLNSYVHRVGRTARAGREGYAVTFVTDDDRSLLKAIAKRAGSKLRSRIVAEKSVNKWVEIIEEMEDQVSEILQEEKEERVLRKAEMEAAKVLFLDHQTLRLRGQANLLRVCLECGKLVERKFHGKNLSVQYVHPTFTAENMVKHMEDIFSRPKRTWFVTEKEKKAMAKTVRDSLGKRKASGNDVTSVEQAEDLETKEKRRREQKKLTRKKRSRLEASGEMMLEDGNETVSVEQNKKIRKDESGASVVELAYRRAKATKGRKRAEDAGKIAKARKMGKKANQNRPRTPQGEVQELLPFDMNSKQGLKAGRTNKSKGSFKSKSRYKRRN